MPRRKEIDKVLSYRQIYVELVRTAPAAAPRPENGWEARAAMALAVFQFLAVFGIGAFTGMLLSIGMSFGAYWKSLSPEALIDWFASNKKGAAKPLGPILLPTLIGLGGALWLQWGDPQARWLWAGALASIVVLLVFTVVYFFPINGRLESRTMPPAQVPATIRQWLSLHWIRVFLSLLAGVLSFIAVLR